MFLAFGFNRQLRRSEGVEAGTINMSHRRRDLVPRTFG
jgi:hypothetical protein